MFSSLQEDPYYEGVRSHIEADEEDLQAEREAFLDDPRGLNEDCSKEIYG